MTVFTSLEREDAPISAHHTHGGEGLRRICVQTMHVCVFVCVCMCVCVCVVCVWANQMLANFVVSKVACITSKGSPYSW